MPKSNHSRVTTERSAIGSVSQRVLSRILLAIMSSFSRTACHRHVGCYVSNALQEKKPLISRCVRRRLYLTAGWLALATWLVMATAELCTPLHAWLHNGAIPTNDDDCAIVAIAHGKIEPVTCDVPVIAQVTWIEIAPLIEFSRFSTASIILPNGRAPPVSA